MPRRLRTRLTLRGRWMLALFAASFVAVSTGSCKRDAPRQTDKPNIILVSIDTCRPDYLGCYGQKQATTPNIDALARQAVLFENTVSPAPTTLPAHASMMTGTIPPFHGVHANIAYRLRPSNVTVAEVLKERGYRTGAFVGAFALESQFGIDQGFDTYDDDFKSTQTDPQNERLAEDVNRPAFAWLDQNAQDPFFLFMHYYDPHYPYNAPNPFNSQFASANGSAEQRGYAGEIAYVDHCIGKLIEKLKALKVYDSSLVIITSDHGEGLGDHGEPRHGYFIYQATTKVPLIIKPPHHQTGTRVTDLVGLIDLAPTILTAANASIPSDVQGEDLTGFLTTQSHKTLPRFFFSESLTATQYGCSSLLGIESIEWKYIQTTKPELYSLRADPAESNNLVGVYPDRARLLQARLRSVLADQTRVSDPSGAEGLDEQQLAKLEALGYVGGKIQEEFTFRSDKEDPKDFLETFIKIATATQLMRRGQPDQAVKLCEDILSDRPELTKAYETLGRAYVKKGDLQAAGVAFEKLIAIQPDSILALAYLGNIRAQQNRPDDAIQLFKQAIQVAEAGLGENDDVDRVLTQLGQIDPALFTARLALADLLFRLKRFEGSVKAYRELLSAEAIPSNRARFAQIRGKAHYQLGVALDNLQRSDEAQAAYQQALKLDPSLSDARNRLRK